VAADRPLVEVDGLTFRYRRATEPAIRDVSLTISPGEVVLVAGPSGCGKSTLIRALNGLIPHSYRGDLSGEVRLRGRTVAGMPLRETSLIVGTVLQDPARQIVGATVETELAFGPENLGLPREVIRDRIRRVATRARIEHLIGRETSELSGGERQLLAMAGILMMEPQIFVVDEPLANLDPATAATLLVMLRELADDGHAVVLVEHRVEEALELEPDRVLYLEAGAPRYLGPVGGFLRVADPTSVKLPFEAILARARAGEVPPDEWSPPPPRTDPAAVDSDVHAGYGEREVLHGVSATLQPAETVAVLGPNGSGKTTLFKAAMRLIEPTSGSVSVDGAPTENRTVADLARVFGYVFQSPSQMLFARTVREELTYGPRNLGIDPADHAELIADSLGRVGLADEENILERAPQTLSFGQQKRLAIAIALALRPQTLILDEPSAGQDHRSAKGFMRSVRTIPGLESIYFVTHDVDLALTHADRILLFRDGRIVADGPPRLVLEDEDRWIQCNLRPTSLMRANAQRGAPGSRFLAAESLARRLARSEPLTEMEGSDGRDR